MELIDKAAVVAEIEKRISLYKVEKSKEDASKVDKISLGARIAMLEEFKIFFDTLEGKGVGLKKIIEQTCPSVLDETVEKMYPMTITPPTPIEVAAYYNAAQQKLRDAFKAGAEWMARQGVNIHGRVLPGTHGNSYVESDWFDKGYGGLSWNDEVDLIIRKKQ